MQRLLKYRYGPNSLLLIFCFHWQILHLNKTQIARPSKLWKLLYRNLSLRFNRVLLLNYSLSRYTGDSSPVRNLPSRQSNLAPIKPYLKWLHVFFFSELVVEEYHPFQLILLFSFVSSLHPPLWNRSYPICLLPQKAAIFFYRNSFRVVYKALFSPRNSIRLLTSLYWIHLHLALIFSIPFQLILLLEI